MKRLYKSRKNKVVDGVCGGIAEYFETDPVLVRFIFILLAFAGGSAVIAYIVGMIIIPAARVGEGEAPAGEKKETKPDKVSEKPAKPAPITGGSLLVGIVLIVLGAVFVMQNFHFFDFYPYYWLKHHFWEYFIPGLLIVVGIVLITKSKEEKKKD
ncbi:MAG: PspC domain-containing protein [Candidatus Aminicenantes bacterium]|nr:PspC domain-containing protein [Candidatus Aminicenantes bacterium]